MAIPISYNIKNIVVRWSSSLITALTIGLAIFILAVSFAILEGLQEARKNVENKDNVLILQKGAARFTDSFIGKETFNNIKIVQGIKKEGGVELVAPEIVTLMNTPRSLQPTNQAFIRLRGVDIDVAQVQKKIVLVKGRFFKKGLNELMVGKNLAEKFPQLDVEKEVKLGTQEWKVVGHFNATGPGYDIEIWGDVEQIVTGSNQYNAVTLTLANPDNFEKVRRELEENKNLNVSVYPVAVYLEKAYYGKQVDDMINAFYFLGILIFVLMAIGAFFTTVNTLYGMVDSRIREMAVLRAIGFSKFSIYLCFIIESCFITLLGGAIGVLLLTPLNNFSVTKWQVLSEVSYNIVITPQVVSIAMIVSLVLGVIGGFLPAWKASRVRMAEVLGK